MLTNWFEEAVAALSDCELGNHTDSAKELAIKLPVESMM